jgi:hypothetical protein
MDATTEADKVHQPLTEEEKLELVMLVADQLAARYGVEPEELWGAGWEAVRLADVGLHSTRNVRGYYYIRIKGIMRNHIFRHRDFLVLKLPL